MSTSPIETSLQCSASDDDEGWSDPEAEAEWPDDFQDEFHIVTAKATSREWTCNCGVRRPPTRDQCTICKKRRNPQSKETSPRHPHIFFGNANVSIIPCRFFDKDCMTQINPIGDGPKSEHAPIQVFPDSEHRFEVSVGKTLLRFKAVSPWDYVLESKEEENPLLAKFEKDLLISTPYGTDSSYIVEKRNLSTLKSSSKSKAVFALDETRPNTVVEVHDSDTCDLYSSDCQTARDFFADSEIFYEHRCPLYSARRLVVRKKDVLCGIYSEDDLWRLVGSSPLVGALLVKGKEVACMGMKIPSCLVICLFEMAEGPMFVASMSYFLDCTPGIKEIYRSKWADW